MKIKDKIDISQLLQEDALYHGDHSEKLKAILDAAENLFSQKSFDETRTADIASEAKVTERTLFKYFPTKKILRQRILYPLVLKFFAPQQFKRVRAIFLQDNLDLKSIIVGLLNDRYKFVRENPGKLKFIAIELLKDDDLRIQLAELWKEHIGILALEEIEKLQKSGKLRQDISSEAILRAIIANVVALVLSTQLITQTQPEHLLVDEMVDIILKGVTVS